MNCRITVMRKSFYRDLAQKYENPITHACDLQVGQVFLSVNGEKPEGLCDSAWDSMKYFVQELSKGNGNFYDGWMKDPHSAMISCNDGFRPVSFLIEAVDDDIAVSEARKGSIAIIGAGIGGLSAGIYAQLAGYESVIFEKTARAGGLCSYWKRGSYTIDNCIHWLGGAREGSSHNTVWKDVGVLGDGIPMFSRESFYSSELNGQTVTLWLDLERSEKEMTELSPEDEKEIKRFFSNVKAMIYLLSKVKNSSVNDIVKLIISNRSGATPFGIISDLLEYGSSDIGALASRFHHPLLKRAILDFTAKEYESYWIVLSYALFVSGNGEIPVGGSAAVVENMVARYLSLGGQIKYETPIERIELVNQIAEPENRSLIGSAKQGINRFLPKRAAALIDGKGDRIVADHYILACDLHYAYDGLLGASYMPKGLREAFESEKCALSLSSFQCAFSVDTEWFGVSDTHTFTTEPFEAGTQVYDRLCVKNYRQYGKHIAPAGNTVVQCSLIQYGVDAEFWSSLRESDHQAYKKKKEEQAAEIENRIIARFPQLEGKLHLLDVWTPASYMSRFNSYKGAYMRFLTSAINHNASIPNKVKGIQNVYLAGQWLQYPGGIPTAALTGKKVIERIKSKK